MQKFFISVCMHPHHRLFGCTIYTDTVTISLLCNKCPDKRGCRTRLVLYRWHKKQRKAGIRNTMPDFLDISHGLCNRCLETKHKEVWLWVTRMWKSCFASTAGPPRLVVSILSGGARTRTSALFARIKLSATNGTRAMITTRITITPAYNANTGREEPWTHKHSQNPNRVPLLLISGYQDKY